MNDKDLVLFDVKHALEFLKWGYNRIYGIEDEYYNKIYPWTNEKLSSYYNLKDLQGKNVLTVTSSGDHALHAILAGATKIDSFDKNRLCKYFSALKIAAIKSFSYEKFMSLTKTGLSDASSNIKTMEKYLTENEALFWNEFINNSNAKKRNRIFKDDGYYSNLKIGISYFDKNYYDKLKNNLMHSKITYYDLDLNNISEIPHGNYDAIFLSNILELFDNKGKEDILNKCYDILNNNGVLYDYHKKYLYKQNKIKRFENQHFIDFFSYSPNDVETVSIYKKIID